MKKRKEGGIKRGRGERKIGTERTRKKMEKKKKKKQNEKNSKTNKSGQ